MLTVAATAMRHRSFVRLLAAACLVFSTTLYGQSAWALSGASATPEAAGTATSDQAAPDARGTAKPAPMFGQDTTEKPAVPGNKPDAEASPPASVEIIRDLNALPEPVRATRQAIIDAASSGDFERLRPLLNFDGDQMRQLGAAGDDTLDALKSLSGDQEGLEILAIMLDLLQTGAARLNAGTPDEIYVWPYFVGKPLDTLSASERVELLRIITAGDLIAMEENNNYNFYRLGISPDGKWKMFSGGD
ncbi:hypothetical protein [Rhizobium straminoryzae]|uniref:Uncharacterized protein n=1 Tax=Rhizobium straminoryzae TaxID=1387186 RepID=A0A549TAK4_9HYPH|nr:hypothetical protein [Rhizobium straminoryzae]TRL38913.1 hypothetical protein FNA46_11295 [Rhizobium straminoryzae]